MIFGNTPRIRTLILSGALFLSVYGAALPSRAATDKIEPDIYYYARLDVTAVNGVITNTHLSMAPATTPSRTEKFTRIRVKGECRAGQTDALQCAKHNALSGLLLKNGLQSLKSARNLKDLTAHDRISMRYEGMVRHPFMVIAQTQRETGRTFSAEMDIWFSPIAFPDKWSMLRFKQTVFQFFKDIRDALI